MDALARIEPVARPLLSDVDSAVGTLGAPPEHPLWRLLRRVAASPADALAHVAALEPERLRGVADSLRASAEVEAGTAVPTGWQGAAGEAFTARAAGLAAFAGADRTGDGGGSTLAGRLRATASYVDDVADWQQSARDRVALALADVLTSAQALIVRLDRGREPAVVAAADIGARVLTAVAECIDEGQRLPIEWAGRLDPVTYVAPMAPTSPADAAIWLRH